MRVFSLNVISIFFFFKKAFSFAASLRMNTTSFFGEMYAKIAAGRCFHISESVCLMRCRDG